MNRERARELLPIIQAFADGRELQFRRTPKNCREAEIWSNDAALTPNYDFHDDYEYRIKPDESMETMKERVISDTEGHCGAIK